MVTKQESVKRKKSQERKQKQRRQQCREINSQVDTYKELLCGSD
jgi:hypothetical protein